MTGLKGRPGIKGIKGEFGSLGAQGDKGSQGARGFKGICLQCTHLQSVYAFHIWRTILQGHNEKDDTFFTW